MSATREAVDMATVAAAASAGWACRFAAQTPAKKARTKTIFTKRFTKNFKI